jgi:transcriptional regulator with XRE-family HTH domain
MGEDFTAQVAAEIRAEMGRQRMSQEALAARIGISQQSLSRRLLGTYPFNTIELAKAAEALNVPVGRLLSRAVSAEVAALS